MSRLDAALLDAHASEDRVKLAALYAQAATEAADDDARGFYLTHAYVYALEAGLAAASDLRAQLVAMGRETPLHGSSTI